MEFEDQALDAWKKRKKNERVKWGISKKVEGIQVIKNESVFFIPGTERKNHLFVFLLMQTMKKKLENTYINF